MPTCRLIGGGLHEVRTGLPGQIARVLFYVDAGQRMVLLPGFIKKSQKTPDADLGIARERMARHADGQAQGRQATMSRANPNTGSSFDSFLEEEGILEEVDAVAVKRVIAWQLQQEMKAQHITKKAMAERLHTSRTQIDRLLDPENAAVHLTTLTRAAREVGLRFKVTMEREKDVANT
jgi:hypothetical protein